MKKNRVINIALLIGLSLAPAVFADGANNLVQLDLKRSSNDAVNVTLFTSNTYGDNVMVRKKSDNKYVILIPKVQSSGYSASNLSGVRDLVSNVDVKTVNDTNGGYTKVTLITTKPLEIKTSTRKSSPQTQEQKEYQTLIAQANAVKNTIAKQDTPPKIREQKTEITVNKAPDKSVVTKKIEITKKETQKPDIKLTEVDPEKVQRQARQEHLAEMIKEVQSEQGVPQEVPEVSETANQPVQNVNTLTDANQTVSKTSNHKRIPKKKIGIGILALCALALLRNLGKSKNVVQQNFVEPLPQEPVFTQTNNDIVDNTELSWKEKYQLYLDKSATPVSRGENKGNYAFIKTPAKPNIIEKKREELEKLVIPHDIESSIEPEIVESEDAEIHKAIKFKAFGNRSKSLGITSRNVTAKSRFKKYEVEIPLHEQKNIELGDSMLHSNPRTFANANLNVSDVAKNRIKSKPQDYIMSSVDEYFSILDKEQPAKTLASNPIAKHKEEVNKGLIVKSGFSIDDKKGFYLVNKDGKNALVGKVNDEVFVLKRFDKNISNPIQVRHDNANVYMVKAGDFKSLVEVNDDKMGVLIEL